MKKPGRPARYDSSRRCARALRPPGHPNSFVQGLPMSIHKFRSWAAAAVCSGMLASPVAVAAPANQLVPGDVALAEGGVLSGQVVDAQGAAIPQAPVALISEGREVIRVAAAQDGTFAVAGLQGGVYELATPGQHSVYRVWTAQTAPPASSPGILLVSGGEVVRGQYGYAPPAGPGPAGPGPIAKTFGWMGQHPFITAGVIATAIAVPVAINEADDAS
jgi:hypothetical protein